MSKPNDRLEAEALELPSRERAPTLDAVPEEDPAEVERAWAEEIERRLEEYRAGKVETILAAEVFAEVRARFQ